MRPQRLDNRPLPRYNSPTNPRKTESPAYQEWLREQAL